MTPPTFFRPDDGIKFHELRDDRLAWCGIPQRAEYKCLFGEDWRSTLEQEDELCRHCIRRRENESAAIRRRAEEGK